MKRRLKRDEKGNPAKGSHPKSVNLYKFIRLVLGTDIPDIRIAHRWDMDIKNFHEFKVGAYPVPRLGKLEELALVLGVNKHLVFQVGGGTPAQKVFTLIKKNDLRGQTRLLSNQLYAAHNALHKSEKRYRELFNNANDAIFIANIKTGILIDCNKQANALLGRPRDEIIGMHQSEIHPPDKQKYYTKHFRGHVQRKGGVNPYKTEVFNKDGTIVPVYISASVIELDGCEVIQGIFRQAGPKSLA